MTAALLVGLLAAVNGFAVPASGVEVLEDEATESSSSETLRLVRDIRPGKGDSYIRHFTEFDGWLYFFADDGVSTNGLWRSDGIVAELVADLRPANATSTSSELVVLGDWLYFAGDDGATGDELWRTDGDIFEQVADIRPGSASSDPLNLTVHDGWLYFSANDGSSGIEPWRTNGDTTHQVADIRSGSGSSFGDGFSEFDGWLYFSAYDGSSDDQLWRTDGDTTEKVSTVRPCYGALEGPADNVLDGWLYFCGKTSANGEELWRTNGVTTSLVHDINPGSDDSWPYLSAVVGGWFYFVADDGSGWDIWRTDGSTTEFVTSGQADNLVSFEGWLYFNKTWTGSQTGLWRTNGGTPERVGPASFTGMGYDLPIHDGWLYFGGDGNTSGGGYWRTDGSTTQRFASVTPYVELSDYYHLDVATLGDDVFILGSDGKTGSELWSTVWAPSFSDVPTNSPFYAEIAWLAVSGVTEGYPDGTFRPGSNVSRQAMAAFLYRAAGEPEFEAPETATFVDVPPTHPFFFEIEWLNDTGITTGYEDSTFRPSANVSRMAMAAFLYRAAGEPSWSPPSTAQFSDVGTAHSFFAEIEWLVSTGVTTGYSDGRYRPSANVTRQAMAAFLYRFLY